MLCLHLQNGLQKGRHDPNSLAGTCPREASLRDIRAVQHIPEAAVAVDAEQEAVRLVGYSVQVAGKMLDERS